MILLLLISSILHKETCIQGGRTTTPSFPSLTVIHSPLTQIIEWCMLHNLMLILFLPYVIFCIWFWWFILYNGGAAVKMCRLIAKHKTFSFIVARFCQFSIEVFQIYLIPSIPLRCSASTAFICSTLLIWILICWIWC